MRAVTHDAYSQLAGVLDEIQVELLAGWDLVAQVAADRRRFDQRRAGTRSEVIRLVGDGRRYLRVIEGNKNAAPVLPEAA